jgi:hypothetical protein
MVPAAMLGPVRMECLCSQRHHPRNSTEREEHRPMIKVMQLV